MPIIAAASMTPRIASGEPGSACSLATATHEPSSNKPKTTACTECHAGLMVLPNIEPAMLTSIAHETNRNGTPSTGKKHGDDVDRRSRPCRRRPRGPRQYLAPKAVERERMDGGEVIEVVPQELGGVGRQQLAAHQHGRDRQAETEDEGDDEDLGEHRGMGQ